MGCTPGFGVLHGSLDHHDGCVYDLMEEFRAPLVEGLALYLFNNHMLKPDMFSTLEDGTCRIGREGQEAVIRGWEHWLARSVRSPRSGDKVTWRGLMEEQVLAYARHVTGAEPYAPYAMDY